MFSHFARWAKIRNFRHQRRDAREASGRGFREIRLGNFLHVFVGEKGCYGRDCRRGVVREF